MPDPMTAAERYRSNAARLLELAKDAAAISFLREYYERLARRYLMHAENEDRIAKISRGSTVVEAAPIPDSPSVQAASEAGSSDEASAHGRPSSSSPLQPAQKPARAPRRRRRRDSVP
jgi:hypothetical protein